MKIKIWHIVLTIFVICVILAYLLIQPYMFWFLAVKQPFTPGHMNKYYIYSANTSVFKFQKEFTYDWIASDAANVTKDYDVALKYIDKLDALNIKMYKDINVIRKFGVYMELKDYDNALKMAQINEKFRNKFEMDVYCKTGDYQKAKEAYKRYWDAYSIKYPKYKDNPMKYYYLAKVEYSGNKYENAHKAMNEYFENYKNSEYLAAWQLRADIAQKRNDKKDYEISSQKVKELNEKYDREAKELYEQMNKDINEAFKTIFLNNNGR